MQCFPCYKKVTSLLKYYSHSSEQVYKVCVCLFGFGFFFPPFINYSGKEKLVKLLLGNYLSGEAMILSEGSSTTKAA